MMATLSSTAARGRLLLPLLRSKHVKQFALYGGITLGVMTLSMPDLWDKFVLRMRGAIRFSRCAWTGALIAWDYKTTLWGLDPEQRREAIKHAHKRSAQRLLKLFQKNAGIFIKAGQHISSLSYIVPEEYTETMRVLQDRAPTRPFSDVEKVFKEEFGRHPDEIFKNFERTPIAAASLAQVHKAVFEGRDVAVKVQFPRLREMCASDVHTIDVIVRAIAWLFPEFQLKWLVDEFNRNLPKELDFVQEARNSEKVMENFRKYKSRLRLAVPEVIWSLTCSRVLTMEFIRGCKVNDVDSLQRMGISQAEVSKLLTSAFSEQIFVHGFVHCDPHPGNILVRPASTHGRLAHTPELVLLDHGLYRQLDDDFRLNYAHLWYAIIAGNEEEIKEYSSKCGGGSSYQLFSSMLTARAWNTMMKDINAELTEEEKRMIAKAAQDYLVEIAAILARVPSDLLLLFKTNDLLRALNRDLGSPINTFSIMLRYCMRGINAERLRIEPTFLTFLRTWRDNLWLNAKLALLEVFLIAYSWWSKLTSIFRKSSNNTELVEVTLLKSSINQTGFDDEVKR